MKLPVFCVHDVKAACYMQPWTTTTDAVAARDFARSVNASDGRPTPMSMNPEDFTLFRVGVFDDETGLIQSLDAPVSLGNGVSFKRD